MACIFLSTGEASGEQYGVQLMQALRGLLPNEPSFIGLGGPRMQAAGMQRVVRAEDVAIMGITEIVRHIPRIYREYRKLRRALETQRPDVLVLIDFPDVNLGLARRAKQLGIPVVFFVGPQVWAWKKHRLKQIRSNVNRMLVIFPFEEQWYRERGVEATFVGHPLAEAPLPSDTREAFALRHGLDVAKPWVGVLPGSRPREIALNLPTMLAAAALLGSDFEYLLPLAPTLTATQVHAIEAMVAATGTANGQRITLLRDARGALHQARASMVASGTATVEAALIGNPFVVVYRLSSTSYAVAKRVVKVPHVAMANLIAGRRLVPELIQHEFTAESVAAAMRPLLAETPVRAAMVADLKEVGAALRQKSRPIDEVAAQIVSLLPGHNDTDAAIDKEQSPSSPFPMSAAL